jgi:hypothetical protein
MKLILFIQELEELLMERVLPEECFIGSKNVEVDAPANMSILK